MLDGVYTCLNSACASYVPPSSQSLLQVWSRVDVWLEAMSLYHDQSSIPFPLPHDARDHLYHPNVDNGHAQGSPSTDTTRFCSVRGCTAPLSPEYPHKMCEACRERHRVYASTKRAKRKMEKSVLNSQTGVSWMPTDGDGGDPGPTASDHPLSEEAQIAIPSQQTTTAYEYAEDPWTTDPVDLRLLSKTVSELEMALTYPYRTFSSSSGVQSSAPVPNSQVASSSTAPFSFIPSTSTPIVPPAAQASPGAKGEISVRNISAVASQAESALPPRYCSIKGCKTVVDGGSLFKMCDSCRMKYKGYGTTKRKKWKEEKTKALAELERQREEENKIRADNGLPVSRLYALFPFANRYLESAFVAQRTPDLARRRDRRTSSCQH